jgi:hypothetical protein
MKDEIGHGNVPVRSHRPMWQIYHEAEKWPLSLGGTIASF